MTKRVLAAVLAAGILAAAGCGREPLSREDAAAPSTISLESSAAGEPSPGETASSSQEGSAPVLESSAPEEAVDGEEPVYYWTADPDRRERLETLQGKQDLTDPEILELAGYLTEKALYLTYLGYGDTIYGTDRVPLSRQQEEADEPERMEVPYGDQTLVFYRVHHLPYTDCGELWREIITVFAPETAERELASLFYNDETGRGIYKDLDGKLYVMGQESVGTIAKTYAWDLDTAEIVDISPDSIRLQMEVTLRERWSDTLELTYQEGRWLLGDSYFASAET
ncbi:MAG TPA: hypothetical protein H9680_01025 [Firmicutes bacterium]|nr:hypothetical protein [Bacillota bacterium]